MERPPVVTICTSYKFKDDIPDVYKQLTEQSFIVLLPAFNCTEHDQEWYLELHKKKIDMCDMVMVIRADEYYGESVAREILYASQQEKPVYGISYQKYEGCLYFYNMLEPKGGVVV